MRLARLERGSRRVARREEVVRLGEVVQRRDPRRLARVLLALQLGASGPQPLVALERSRVRAAPLALERRQGRVRVAPRTLRLPKRLRRPGLRVGGAFLRRVQRALRVRGRRLRRVDAPRRLFFRLERRPERPPSVRAHRLQRPQLRPLLPDERGEHRRANARRVPRVVGDERDAEAAAFGFRRRRASRLGGLGLVRLRGRSVGERVEREGRRRPHRARSVRARDPRAHRAPLRLALVPREGDLRVRRVPPRRAPARDRRRRRVRRGAEIEQKTAPAHAVEARTGDLRVRQHVHHVPEHRRRVFLGEKGEGDGVARREHRRRVGVGRRVETAAVAGRRRRVGRVARPRLQLARESERLVRARVVAQAHRRLALRDERRGGHRAAGGGGGGGGGGAKGGEGRGRRRRRADRADRSVARVGEERRELVRGGDRAGRGERGCAALRARDAGAGFAHEPRRLQAGLVRDAARDGAREMARGVRDEEGVPRGGGLGGRRGGATGRPRPERARRGRLRREERGGVGRG